jgi:hypothetical protein
MGHRNFSDKPTDEHGMSMTTKFPIVLRTSRRDIRITGGKGSSFLNRPLDAGALQFAGVLLRRYLGREWSDPLHGLILGKNRIGAAIQHLHRHQQISITPNLALTVLNWTGHSRVSDRPAAVPPAPHLRYQQNIELIRGVTRKQETHILEQFVDQVIWQKRRVEVNSQPSPAGNSALQVPDVKRVVRRTVTPIQDQAPIDPVTVQRMEGKLQERKPSNQTYGSPEAPIDLNRLTDQIIQKIDHRIVAQRERLGRV